MSTGKRVSKTKAEFAKKANSAYLCTTIAAWCGATDGHESTYLNHDPGFE